MTGRLDLWSPDSSALADLPAEARVFALAATARLGAAIATALGRAPAPHEERAFEDGVHKARPLESVAGDDCYVIQSLHGDADQSVNDKLCRLLFFIGALKDAGAARVTAVAPYLCYARKDRRTKPFDPVTTRYVAALFEAVGTDRILTLEVHNPAAFENAFRGRAITLSPAPLFVMLADRWGEAQLCVLSPDPGGAKRAALFHEALEQRLDRTVGKAFVDKRRSAGVVSGEVLAGEVRDATVLVVDDLISTGGTLARAARAAKGAGAHQVIALASHGLFAQGAEAALSDPALDGIIVTDTAAPFGGLGPAVRGRVEVLSSAPLLAEAIRRLARAEPLTDLLVF
jgi:ribose-phosphate pyrophosphokinase